jgi:hypothetical protein
MFCEMVDAVLHGSEDAQVCKKRLPRSSLPWSLNSVPASDRMYSARSKAIFRSVSYGATTSSRLDSVAIGSRAHLGNFLGPIRGT